jgi:hypothetical protein
MLLNIIKKMIHFDESGRHITEKNSEHNSVVANFSGQIQANLRFNLRSEFNNSSNTMKKIYEICYLFYKLCYKNDKDLFLSQFWLFYDPVFPLTKLKSRDDSIFRLKFLCKIVVSLLQDGEAPSEVLRILTRKEGGPQQLLDLLESFLDDTLGVLMSGSTQKNQIETLKIRIINDKLEVNLYIETIPTVVASYMALHSAMKVRLEKIVQMKIKFVLCYVLVSDHLLKKIVGSIDKAESKVEAYDIEKYFDDRKAVISSLNILLEHDFSFNERELELIFRVLANLIQIGAPDILQLIKDFCFLALKSPAVPKDRALLELINLFPSGQVKMAGIMAGLHKAISLKDLHGQAGDGEFDLEQMGETVIGRFVQESLSFSEVTDEVKQTSVTILTLDLELFSDTFSEEIVDKYRKGSKTASFILLGLLAKCEKETASQIIANIMRSDFLLFYQSLITFTETVKENKATLATHFEDLIKVYEVCISCILDSLQTKKSEEVEKKLNLFMLTLHSLCDLMLTTSEEDAKKSLILLIYSSSDFLLGKIPAKFFDERVFPLLSTRI